MKILKFGLPRCAPCKTLSKQIANSDIKDRLNIQEIDASQERDIAFKYKIMKVPTMVVLDDDGNEINRIRTFDELCKI